MTTIPNALADAYQLLRHDLYLHIDAAEYLAMKVPDWKVDDIVLAREVIPDLVDVIRTVLKRHDATSQGSCTLSHDNWPCATVQAVHELVKDPKRNIVHLIDPDTGDFR